MWAADSRGVLLTCLLQACSLPGHGAGTGPTYLLVAMYTLLPYLLNYTRASDMIPRPGRAALPVCPQPPSQHCHHVPGGTSSDPGPQSALQSPGSCHVGLTPSGALLAAGRRNPSLSHHMSGTMHTSPSLPAPFQHL